MLDKYIRLFLEVSFADILKQVSDERELERQKAKEEKIKRQEKDKMTPEEFNNAVVSLSKRTIRNKLRPAALTYDSTIFINHKIVFNINAINNLVNAYNGLKSSLNKDSFTKSLKIGRAAFDPVSNFPKDLGTSCPTKTPTVNSDENPMNHAS